MNAPEALQVLINGGRVEDCYGEEWTMDDKGFLVCRVSSYGFGSGAPFKLHVEPATDEELIAEMERIAQHTVTPPAVARAWREAAKMLKTRKVMP